MKTELLKVRVEPLEKRAFEDAAGVTGAPLSVWIRAALRRAARVELEEAGEKVPFAKQQRGGAE